MDLKSSRIALVIAGALLLGCNDPAKPATGNTPDPAAAANQPAGPISVPECDDYLKKVDACKGPAAAGIKGSAAAIRANLKNPAGTAAAAAALKVQLATTCKSAMPALAACQ
jgi:hypothetical protein